MMIGVIASAPMGPVGILCVQRTLNKGRWFGLATGVGAAASDIIYAAFAGFGMSFVMDLINNDQNRFYLQIVGSVMLLCFGIYTYRTDPTRKMHQSGQQKGTLWYNTWTAFLVTFSNPLIIFLFLAMYAQFAFVLPNHPFEMLVGFASIVCGALLWWWGLTWLVDKIRTRDDALHLCHKVGVWVWSHSRTHDIKGIGRMTTPVADGSATSIRECHVTSADGMNLGSQHLHAFHICVLPFHVCRAHEHFALHIHQRTDGCCGYTVLSSTVATPWYTSERFSRRAPNTSPMA